jgi:hypothetical protein
MLNLRLWGFGLIAGLVGVLVLPLMAASAPPAQPDASQVNELLQKLHEQSAQIRDLQRQLADKDATIRNLKRQMSILPRMVPPTQPGPYRIPPLPGDLIPMGPGKLPPGTIQRQFNGAPVYEIPIREDAKSSSASEGIR